MLKINNRNTRTRCEICSKLKIKTVERVNASWIGEIDSEDKAFHSELER